MCNMEFSYVLTATEQGMQFFYSLQNILLIHVIFVFVTVTTAKELQLSTTTAACSCLSRLTSY